MKTKPYDQAFKFLAEQDPEALLRLLGAIEPGEQATIELLPREISIPALLPDQPYLVRSARGERVVHVEAWIRWSIDITSRMAEYGPLHWFKYRLPVDSYVILLLSEKLPRRIPRSGVIEAGGVRLETRFHLIRLWRLPAQAALRTNHPALLPFVPLMKGGRAELEAAATKLREIAEERERLEVAQHLAMLGTLRYNQLDILELIGRRGMIPLEQLRESGFYQFILAEGREEGRAEGRAEGREATIDVFRVLAETRFPGIQLSDELEAVRDVAGLRRLAHELNRLPDAEALRHKLGELSQAPR